MLFRHSVKKVLALVGTTSSAWGFSNNIMASTTAFGGSATSSVLFSSATESLTSAKNVLFDIPVSNNGGRARIILYKKEIPESECSVVSPAELGGFKSEEYLKVNPQGKVPSMRCQATGENIAESDTVCRYLLDTYSSMGPSFQPNNPLSNEIARFHDMYLTTIQACLYKAAPPFGIFGTRTDALKEYSKQLYVIADLMQDSKYMCGDEVSLADATVFPSIVFATYMFPKFEFGAEKDPIPQKIQNWFQRMIDTDSAFEKVYNEMSAGLAKWNERGRWDTIWLAGVRDTEPATLFDKIVSKEIPATIVKEDDKILAFKDINPAAPAHVLVIPKDRDGLTRLSKSTPEHYEILGRLMVAAGEIAKDESLGFGDGARIVINDGASAGQEVFHLHVHILGGREFSWPPG
mmetsp:Transcript_13702/g.34460  ORF Transcript_13702/g.34460 Transcript_13702/m.34460 type:complete len:406 (+) Transcript_13702:87-1304(+)